MQKAGTLEEAVSILLNDYKKAAIEAAAFATEQVMNDFSKHVESELEQYYKSYNPSSYNRTFTLKNCIVPFSSISAKGKKINCTMRIDFDFAKLEGQKSYLNGEGKPSRFYRGYMMVGKEFPEQTSPIGEFIMNNFLEGLHPATDGSTTLNAPYRPKQKRHIEHFIDKYVNTMEKDFTDWFYISLIGQLANY